jgi:site-specific DNA-cytosine methylase
MRLKHTLNSYSDLKAHARKFVKQNFKGTHIFSDISDQTHGHGVCEAHNTVCTLTVQERLIDWFVMGLSCHPFSTLRQKNGRTPKTGTVTLHPEYSLLTSGLPDFLDERLPGGVLIEEVEGLMAKDPSSGRMYMEYIFDIFKDRDYSIQAVALDLKDWVKWPRPRLPSPD